MAGTRARIGDVVFEGGDGLEGFFLDLEDGFTGWDDSVAVRRQQIEMANAHGDYDLPGFRGTRLIVLSGDCVSDSPERQQWFSNRLTGILADGGKGRLTVEHQGTTMWADVRLGGDPKFASRVYGTLARYQISFLAADPRKYGETNRFGPDVEGATLGLFHRGNFPAAQTYWINGSADGYAVYGPGGRRFLITRPLEPGHTHRFDSRTKRLYVDGVRVFGFVQEAFTWTVPGGSTTGVYIDFGTGSGTLQVDVDDTFS